MLRSTGQVIGYHLTATDGNIGRVHDFAFDDRTWNIRYIVADTGGWLAGRQVLLSPHSFGSPDWKEGAIPVSLSKDQIENSPGVDSDQPVSRQHEIDLHKYYGWPPYWSSIPLGGIGWVPFPTSALAEDEFPESGGDPNLRSVKEVTGYHIRAEDGDIGHLEDFIFDDQAWVIRYLVIDTRNWIPGKRVLIAPEWGRSIGWEDRKIHLSMSRQGIKNAPEYDPATPVNREYEERLYDYHGRPRYW